MGFLSSLFQTGTPTQQVAGPAVVTQKLPEELAPYYKDILGKAQALYKEKTAEGYKPYTGPTIAEFTPEQQQAFTGISGLVGQAKPVYDEAMTMTRGAADPITGEQITDYMSPYQQAVTDIEKREAQKTYESQVQPQLAAQAAQAQAFGGSRQGILEGMAADTQQRLQADIQAKGSQQAYQEAIRRLEAERTRTGQAGAQLATMAPQALKTQLGEFGALQTIGEEKQKQTQTALDEAYRQYALEQNYPYDTMAKYQSVVTGAPMGKTEFAQPQARTPSIGQQLIGSLGTIANAYGAFGGKLPGYPTPRKHGGGLSDLPIVHRQSGQGFGGFQRPLTLAEQRDADLLERNRAGLAERDTKDTIANIMAREQKWQRDNPVVERSAVKTDATEIAKEIKDEASVNGVPTNGTTSVSGVPPSGIEELYNIKFGEESRKQHQGIDIKGYNIDFDLRPMIKSHENLIKLQTELAGTDRPTTASQLEESKNWKKAREEVITNRYNEEKSLMEEYRLKDEAERAAHYGDKEQALQLREKSNQENYKREQYGNLAMFFARLGTATPKSEGISGLLGAGLEAAEETLPQAMETRRSYVDKDDLLQDRREAIKDLRRSEGIADTKEGRKLLRDASKDKISQEDTLAVNNRNEKINAKRTDYENKRDDLGNAIAIGESESKIMEMRKSLVVAETSLAAVLLEMKGVANFPENMNVVKGAIEDHQGGEALKAIPNNAKIKEAAIAKAETEAYNMIHKLNKTNIQRSEINRLITEYAKELLSNDKWVKEHLHLQENENENEDGNRTKNLVKDIEEGKQIDTLLPDKTLEDE